MHDKIRDPLGDARPAAFKIPPADGSRAGQQAHNHAHDHHGHDHGAHDHHHPHDHGDGSGCGCGPGAKLMTPLQAEFLEDGELPESDLLAMMLGRADVAAEAGYAPGGPKPLSGPREDFEFECGLKVLQWEIDPHDTAQTTRQHEVRIGDWDYRVWWQAHPGGDLLYVSMQAMREDWIAHEGASPHPVGRSEAVNLVFDVVREAVVAIYGTARDFRPFVKAFALARERDAAEAAETGNREGQTS